MATRRRRVILFVLMVGLMVTTVLATKVEVEKRKLAADYAKAQLALGQLEQERTHLNQELVQARDTMTTQAGELSNLQTELSSLQTRFAQTETELAQLKTDQTTLQHANANLLQQFTMVNQEKQALEARLASLKELRLAIRDVQQKLVRERWHAWLAHVELQRTKDEQRLAQGNRGFIVRHGMSTLASTPSTKLQVRVLDPETK